MAQYSSRIVDDIRRFGSCVYMGWRFIVSNSYSDNLASWWFSRRSRIPDLSR